MTQRSADKRRRDRVRTMLSAQAYVGPGFAIVACQVKDLSPTGARIFVDEAVGLPRRFELRIPSKSVVHQVEMRWRESHLVGVEFVREPRAVELDPVARIRELEAQNAELRRRVADMADRLYAYGASEEFQGRIQGG